VIFVYDEDETVGAGNRKDDITDGNNGVDFGLLAFGAVGNLHFATYFKKAVAVWVEKQDTEVAGLTVFAEIGFQFDDEVHGWVTGRKLAGVDDAEYAHDVQFTFGGEIGVVGGKKEGGVHSLFFCHGLVVISRVQGPSAWIVIMNVFLSSTTVP